MTNRSRDKGTRFESAVVEYLREHGWIHAERRARRGNKDAGDVAGIAGVCVEVKAEKRIALAEYLNETEAEKANANAAVAACWIKRPRKGSPGDAYVVMNGQQFVELLKRPATDDRRIRTTHRRPPCRRQSAVRDYGSHAQAQCPSHEDRRPSLTIYRKPGRVKPVCYAGCDDELDILPALDLAWPDKYDEPRSKSSQLNLGPDPCHSSPHRGAAEHDGKRTRTR